MGSGKSTVAKGLARFLNMKNYDLDREIEKVAGRSIEKIFSKEGEEEFRKIEAQELRKLLEKKEEMIISCGGGTPCYYDNMDIINEMGFSLYLKANVQLISDRLKQSKQKRPLIEGLENDEISDFVSQKLTEREPFYSRASLTFDAANAKANLRLIVQQLEDHWR